MTSADNRRRRRRRQTEAPPPNTPPEKVRLAIGYIAGAHGIRGEVKFRYTTDRPDEMTTLTEVYFDDDPEPVSIEQIRPRNDGKHAIIKFAGVNYRDEAERLRGVTIRVRGDQLPPLDDETYFYYQIIGLQVSTEAGDQIGEVTEIISAGEVDVYVVTGEGGAQQLFPALPDVVLTIDPAQGIMVVRPQRWEDDQQEASPD